jgi:hypothetical protein
VAKQAADAIAKKQAADPLYSSLFITDEQHAADRKKAPAWIISTKRSGFAE